MFLNSYKSPRINKNHLAIIINATFESDRYPELLKSPDTCESLYSDRNSSYDNVEKRNMDREDTPDSRKDRTYDPSEWETMLDTDVETDIEKVKRNKSFKERLDPLLCKFYIFLIMNRLNI